MTTKAIDTGAAVCTSASTYDEVAAAYMLDPKAPRRFPSPVRAHCPGCGDRGPHTNATDIYGLAAICMRCGMFFDVRRKEQSR